MTCFIVDGVVVVGDRLVSTNESSDIEVRRIHAAGVQVVRTIPMGGISWIMRMSPVAGHTELIVTGGLSGDVHLWDIDKCESARTYINEHLPMSRCVRAPYCDTRGRGEPNCRLIDTAHVRV